MKYRLLIVEDDPPSFQILWATLNRAGYALDMATTAPDALALARLTQYDAMLLDVGLPPPNGIELCRQLRLNPATAQVPIIATSAHALSEEIEQAKQAGFTYYLTKPLNLASLPSLVHRLIEERREVAEGHSSSR